MCRLLVFLFIFFFAFLGNLNAKNEIVAIIGNKDVITEKDLSDFIKIEMIFNGDYEQTKDEKAFNALKGIFLQRLIDDKLVIYHAKKRDIDINSIDVYEIENELSKRIKSTSDIYEYFESLNIDKQSVKTKMKSIILRNLFVSQMLKRRNVSEELIDEEIEKSKLENTKENRSRIEFSISIEPSEEEISRLQKKDSASNKNKIKNEIMAKKKSIADSEFSVFLRKMYYVEIV